MAGRFTEKAFFRIVGLLGLAHETLVKDIDRPSLLLVFTALIGLPEFLKRDKKEDSES